MCIAKFGPLQMWLWYWFGIPKAACQIIVSFAKCINKTVAISSASIHDIILLNELLVGWLMVAWITFCLIWPEHQCNVDDSTGWQRALILQTAGVFIPHLRKLEDKRCLKIICLCLPLFHDETLPRTDYQAIFLSLCHMSCVYVTELDSISIGADVPVASKVDWRLFPCFWHH